MKFEKNLLDSTIKSTTNDCPTCASFEEEEGRIVRMSGEKPVLRKSEMQREKVLLTASGVCVSSTSTTGATHA